jgi:hypothetical protein
MKKLTLKLSDLRVETFATAEQTGGKGTVQGHYGTNHTMQPVTACQTQVDTCGRQWSNEGTCDQTCGQPATCGYAYCGTYPQHGCPNTEWFCTNCEFIC